MTRLPAENRNVKGRSDFSSPEFLQQCSHPFCSESRNLESHHIWRRSFLGGAYNHVELWDGTIVGNVVLLCREHHRGITENKATIEWGDLTREFYWTTDNWMHSLSPQPEILRSDSKPSDTPDEPTPYLTPGNAGEGVTDRSRLWAESCEYCKGYPDADMCTCAVGKRLETSVTVVHGGKTFHLHTPKEGEECPTCKRKVPAKKKREPAKNRVSLTFRVPKDSQENGAEVLEDLIVEVEKLLYPENEPRPGYYTLCDGLGLVLVNKEIIL